MAIQDEPDNVRPCIWFLSLELIRVHHGSGSRQACKWQSCSVLGAVETLLSTPLLRFASLGFRGVAILIGLGVESGPSSLPRRWYKGRLEIVVLFVIRGHEVVTLVGKFIIWD